MPWNGRNLRFLPLCILLCILTFVSALYEDQIGKFDWRQQNIGKIIHGSFDSNSAGKRVIVATDEHVLAALHSGTGRLLWRQVLESNERGAIAALSSSDGKIVTVVGSPMQFHVKTWDAAHGYLVWESVLPRTEGLTVSALLDLTVKDNKVHVVELASAKSKNVLYTAFSLKTGNQESTKNIPLPFTASSNENCQAAFPKIVCQSEQSVLSVLNVLTEETGSVETQDVPVFANMKLISRQDALYLIGSHNGQKDVYVLAETLTHVSSIPNSVNVFPYASERNVIFYVATTPEGYSFTFFDANGPIANLDKVVTIDSNERGPVELALAYPLTDSTYRCLLSTEDYSVLYVNNAGEITWTREESLAAILSVEIVELPVSEAQASIEEEFSTNNGMVTRVVRRLSSQLQQLVIFAKELYIGVKDRRPNANSDQLVRDKFGLHKLIVATTKSGKLFGIDSLTGKIIWRKRISGLQPTAHENLPLYLQRSTSHYPLSAQCIVLGTQNENGKSMLYTFDPITGRPIEGDGRTLLNYTIRQTMLLHTLDEESQHLKPLVVLDDQEQVHLFPNTEAVRNVIKASPLKLFMYTVDKKTCEVVGYTLRVENEKVIALRVWEMRLCPNQGKHTSEEIVLVQGKRREETVHSQGRVLGDRSVLYKYVNPNLIAIAVQGWEPQHKGYLVVYLIDSVTGAMVHSVYHKRIQGPVHLSHSENWLVYSFFNEKSRRVEMASLELFEGPVQSNTTEFSSFTAPHPHVDKQAYILPVFPTAMKDTVTEKGLTSKHLIVALTNGGLLELPRFFLDPRRPLIPTAESREEGLMQYLPELPVPWEAMINYNQTVLNVKGIHTAPAGLESTSLVFSYGLDLFYTRVTPSKTFDVLKDDFEYFFISAVLLGLVLASWISRRLAARKALRQAWK